MTTLFQQCLWENFGASIKMLKNAITLYPASSWEADKRFFYLAYHTLIFLDYYLTIPVKDFRPLLPYTILPSGPIPNESVDDVIPNRHYSQEEMLKALNSISSKCKSLILDSDENKLQEIWIKDFEIEMHGLCPDLVHNYTVLEILFYNFRHVQHHVGQLNFLLRQKIDDAPEWVSMAES
ncbi:MAG: hypothetical protein KDC80_03475 [Saprospiraceae bacterium]|nr:hypothetical protein [Saprospiraceae bacterium]